MLGAAIDWTNVLDTLVLAIPSIIAAIYAGRVHRKIQTPSGTPIGKQVENNLHTGLANNYRLRAVAEAVKAPESLESHAEAEQVPNLPEGNGESGG